MKKVSLLLVVMLLFLCALPMTAWAQSTDPVASPSQDAAATPVATSKDAPSVSDKPTVPIVSPVQLSIDSTTLYLGMNKPYQEGYIPTVKDDNVTLVLPLIGETKTGQVDLAANLGSTINSPFVFGNYSQIAKAGSPYVFSLVIPLASGRINGTYPVTLNATFLDKTGAQTTQSFILYVTITDGKTPVDPNAPITPNDPVTPDDPITPVKETVDKPELFISACVIKPNHVGANKEFSVTLDCTDAYGGIYTIAYADDAGEEHKIEIEFTMEITKPIIEGEEEIELTEEPAFQWWVTILVGLAIISIIVAVIVVTKVLRSSKMK